MLAIYMKPSQNGGAACQVVAAGEAWSETLSSHYSLFTLFGSGLAGLGRRNKMDSVQIEDQIKQLALLDSAGMYLDDFLLTWDRSDDEIAAVFKTAEILRNMRRKNISPRAFDSGLAISLFRDNSTRTRFSFSSASNLLGLTVQDLDEGKSQIAHGETVRETANMVSFMADVIGIRDDMYIGKGNTYMREVSEAVSQGYEAGILEQRPTLVNLQCDIDHPTQSMADALHLIQHLGGIENLKGKKIAMSWAYSPSYGKPLSVPQGVVGLMTRFGMDVVLAHPEGYGIMPEVEAIAKRNAAAGGGSFTKTGSMAEAFEGADIVYPKSWAPFNAMEKRTELYGGMHRGSHGSHKKQERAVHALPAGGYHRRQLRPGRSRRLRVRPLPGSPLQGSQFQTRYYCCHDFSCQVLQPGGETPAASQTRPETDNLKSGKNPNVAKVG